MILLLAGIRIGLGLGRPVIPLALALVALGSALGSRLGLGVVLMATGLAAAWVEGADVHETRHLSFDQERPVLVTVSRTGPWKKDQNGHWARAEASILRQGGLVVPWKADLVVSVGGSGTPRPETRLRARGYLRRSTRPANRAGPRGDSTWRLKVKSTRFLQGAPGGEPGLSTRWARSLRQRAVRALEALPADGAGMGLANALVLGERDALPRRLRRGLRRSGLSHLLAISGLHVALLASLALIPGAWLPRVGRLVLVGIAIPVYLVLVGPRPSLIRASVMALLAWHGFWVGRPAESVNTLACAAGGMALLDPELMNDLGFRLTLSATAGIVVLGSRLEARWSWLPERLRRPVAASVSAQIATLPWAVPSFGLLVPLAPVWNLLAIPWTALCLVASLLLTSVAMVHPGWAAELLPALDLMAWPFLLPAWLAPGPWRPRAVAMGLPAALILGVLLSWWVLGRHRVRWLAVPALVLMLSGRTGRSGVSLTMIDVGQGDAILLQDGGEAVLVDGGGWSKGDLGGDVLLPVLARQGLGRLHAVVLTHPDRDHCGGLLDLASYVEIGEVWMAPGWRDSDCVRRLLTLPAVSYGFLWSGEARRLGRWRLTSLHPAAGDRSRGNDRSLVLLAEAMGTGALLTGDLEARGELRLVAQDDPGLGGVDLLKVAHHGSAGSTTPELLDAVRPRLALISAGLGNRYGHPSPLTLGRLSSRGIPVLRTDRDGLVRVDLAIDGRLSITLPAGPR